MSGKEDYCVYEMPCTEMIEQVVGNNLEEYIDGA